ncbi:Atrial natriuretic peptide receptor 1 [Lamellibrachia satsuma]|nr:Atrial natriuretic peptide receptor 1 [Lamellibrachia satsuma]
MSNVSHPLYCVHRQSPSLLRSSPIILSTASIASHPLYSVHRQSSSLLRLSPVTLSTPFIASHPLYCVYRQSPSLLRPLAVIILCVPLDELHAWMVAARAGDMHRGDYVFIYTSQETLSEARVRHITNRQFWHKQDGTDEEVRAAYENLIMVFTKTMAFGTTNDYLKTFDLAASSSSWARKLVPPSPAAFYSLFLYDAMAVYARAATKAGSTRDGRKIFNAAKGTLIRGGATGDVTLSKTADRIPDFWFFDLDAEGAFAIVSETASVLNQTGVQRLLKVKADFRWGDGATGLTHAPPDTPRCGFEGEKCANFWIYVGPALVSVVLLAAIATIVVIHRKMARERDIENMTWKLDYRDILTYSGKETHYSQMHLHAKGSTLGLSNLSSQGNALPFMKVANYKGNTVVVKSIHKTRVNIDRKLKKDMRTVMELKHTNLNLFYGACVDPPNICSVWEHCPKGSLQDVIWNENVRLDDMFKFSICVDIVKGLRHLHESELKCHTKLKSSNVVIDGRWVCKLTDYGLGTLLAGKVSGVDGVSHAKYANMFWTAPEVLRCHREELQLGKVSPCECQSPPADIYSLGVVWKETFCRNNPYSEHEELSPNEIIQRVAKPNGNAIFRPSLNDLGVSPNEEHGVVRRQLAELIAACLSEEPCDRPTAYRALKEITKLNPFRKTNILDNMAAMMETYSNHLEEVVHERTLLIEEERKRTETILYRMLPKCVADVLKTGGRVEAEHFDDVTIYFSDVVRFTDLVVDSTPIQCLASHPPLEWRGTAALPRKKSTPSLVPCVTPAPEWRGTAALPRKKSTPSLVPCVTPAPRVERDSCSAKEEVNTFLSALRHTRPQSGEGQLLCQGRSQHLP